MPLAAVALDATLLIANSASTRRVAAADFFVGHFTTAIETGELLTHIEFPIADHTWAFEEVARRPGDFALVMAAVGLKIAEGRCTAARIALGSVSDRPLRACAAEALLIGQTLTDTLMTDAARAATASLQSHGDIHASAQYRREVAATLVKRALYRAAREASA
jgi:carbon-monoxide dehydrogenase medium subunit